MNITFIVESYYPSSGGVQNVTKYLAEGLAKLNHNVTIVTTQKYYAKEEILNGVKIKRFNIKKSKLKKYSGEINEYINYILEQNEDYVIFECTENITTDLLLPYLDRIKGKRILHMHGCYGLTLKPFIIKESIIKTIGNTYNYFYWNIYYYPYFLSKYINKFDATISLSEVDSGIKYLNKNFKGKRYILGNAADDIFFNILEDGTKKYDFMNKQYFLSVANYRTIKNQIKLLEQFEKSKYKEEYNLVFIGNEKNKYYKKLVKLKDKMKLRNVYILTGIPRKEIPIITKNSFVYLVASTYEEYSISIIEAMTLGIPFITTNVGNAKLLPGGIVLKNINEMSTKINEIIEEKELYLKLSDDGKRYAFENCKIEKCIKDLLKILELIKA